LDDDWHAPASPRLGLDRAFWVPQDGSPREDAAAMGPKIAIIGGGIGGLTVAVALARRGLAAEVYEQAPALEEVGAGVGLWPNAMSAFEPIGLAGKVAQLAVPFGRHGVRRPDGTWLMYIPAELMAKRWGPGS
jgi:2-polyprenyl-6-methoxyphenol hydroxylase-like FAD-dependent oxidoreductase